MAHGIGLTLVGSRQCLWIWHTCKLMMGLEDGGYNEDMVEGASVIDSGSLDWWWMTMAPFL